MIMGFDQYVGKKVELVYIDDDNQTRQLEVEILSIGSKCITAYCFADDEPRLFRNDRIIGLMPRKSYYH